MSPSRIPEIKTWIRDLSAADLAELAGQCLGYCTASDVQRHLESFFEHKLAPLSGSVSGSVSGSTTS
jgi:phosphoenolpyruvate-protein kinase (PTS system EI component)